MRFQDGLDPVSLLAHLQPLLSDIGALKGVALPKVLLALDDPERSGPESLTVVGSHVRLEERNRLQAALVLAEEGVEGFPASLFVLRIANAHKTLAALVNAFAPQVDFKAPFLDGEVILGEGAHVGAGSFIGGGTRIEPKAVIQENCIIGRNCVIQSGAVIGCAGFGFFDAGERSAKGAGTAKGLELMPHLAGVRIGDNCFIGANTVIAAGVLHPTEIGDDCKLDSHVQIAHNVRLGRGCLLASQSGIAGSTVVGDGLRMGGAASIAGHLRLGKNVSVAAKSGVTKDLPDGAVVAGFPARPIGEWRRREIFLKNKGT